MVLMGGQKHLPYHPAVKTQEITRNIQQAKAHEGTDPRDATSFRLFWTCLLNSLRLHTISTQPN
jgi:hypothetical protein